MAFHVFSYWLFTAFQWSAIVALSPNTPYSFAAESSVSIRYLPTSRAYSFYHSLSLELTPAHRHFSLLLIFQILQFAQILIADLQHFVQPFQTRLVIRLAICLYVLFCSLASVEFTSSRCYPLYSEWPHTSPCQDIPVLLLFLHTAPDYPALSPHMHPPDSDTPDKDFFFLPDFDFTHSRLFHGIVRHLHSPDLLCILQKLHLGLLMGDIHIINGSNICIWNKNFDSKSYKNITMLFFSRE